MSHINPNLIAAAGSPIMEAAGWVAAADLPPDRPLLDFSQAAPKEPPPEPMRRHMAEAIETDPNVHFYGPVLGDTALRAEIAQIWSRDYAAPIDRAEVAITSGCNQAFCVAVLTACAPGDAVMLPYPWYFNHKMWLDMAGIRCVPLPSGPDLLPDLERARALMGEGVKAIVMVTPNNPTGAEYPDTLLGAFYDLARDHDAVLIVDETYRDFRAGDGAAHTLFQRPDRAEVLIHLYSFSKIFRITGHRIGAMIAGPDRIAEAEKILDTVTICPSRIGQTAALYGLRNLGDWAAGQRTEIAARRAALAEGAAAALPGWRIDGLGAYFAWVRPPFGIPAPEMARRLVAEQSVLVLPGTMFLPPSAHPTDALRIAFANAARGGLERLVERLAAFRP